MRPSRRSPTSAFRLEPLEGRLALSTTTPAPAPTPTVHVGPMAPGAPAPGTDDLAYASFSVPDALHLGYPVYDQRVTRLGDKKSQTDDQLIVPTGTSGGSTTFDWIKLADGGVEISVDVATTSSTQLGRITTTHATDVLLPDGAHQTSTETDVSAGDTTVVHRTVNLPGGGTETVSAVVVQKGPTRTEDQTVTEPDGSTRHNHVVTVDIAGTTNLGETTHQSTTETSTQTGHSPVVTKSYTSVTRLQAPA